MKLNIANQLNEMDLRQIIYFYPHRYTRIHVLNSINLVFQFQVNFLKNKIIIIRPENLIIISDPEANESFHL